jgi:AcrR family transcriptional regulator
MASRDSGEGVAHLAGNARSRILETAYDLFSHDGIRAVGIDKIIAEAGIAKATLYRHFASKQDLVLAFLELREQRWTREWLEGESERRAARPQECVFTVWDTLDDWFHRSDYEGCSFINTLLEISDAESAIHRGAAHHLAVVRKTLERYARQAGTKDPQEMGYQLQVLMMGAIVSACGGDLDAARRAQDFAGHLIAIQR